MDTLLKYLKSTFYNVKIMLIKLNKGYLYITQVLTKY